VGQSELRREEQTEEQKILMWVERGYGRRL
jgi:hypothetical protein